MNDRSYVFRLLGEPGQLLAVTEQAGRSFDTLAAKSEQSSARSVVADRAATQSRQALASATTSLGATSFVRYQDSLKGLEQAGTSLGATSFGVKSFTDTLGTVPAVAGRIPGALRPADQAIKGLGVTAGQTANAMRQLPAQFTDIFTQLAGGQNPLLIAVQQGGQIKDSFGGIGPAFTALKAAITPTIVALSASAAAIGLVTYAAYLGNQQETEYNKSIVLTGNYAGVTAGQMDVLSRSISVAANVTVGAARDALQAVVSTGAFGPKLIEPVSTAVARMSALTGQSAEQVAGDFAKMGDGVAKYAAEHNKSMHLISAAQYEQIKALEQAGKAEEAQGIYLAALNQRLAEHDKSIGSVGRAWQDAKNKASEYLQQLANIGKGATIDDALATAQADLARLRAAQNGTGIAGFRETVRSLSSGGSFEPQIREQEQLVARLLDSKRLGEQVAASTADVNRRQAAGIAGSQVVDAIKKEIDKRTEATKKIEEYTVAVRKMREANDPKAPTAAQEAADIAALQEKYKTKGQKDAEKLDNRFKERLVALQQEGVKLDAETRSFELYGRSVDKARVAVLDLEIAQGKLKGISPAQIAQLRALASANDARDQRVDQARNEAEADRSIAKLREEASLKQTNARDSEVAQRLAAMEAQGVKVGTAAYIENAASIRTWVGIKHDQLLERTLAQQQRETDNEVVRLEEETRLLGASTVERQKAIAALRLQAQAQKDIAANPGQTAQILDAMISKRNELTAAIERNYTASRTFEAGASAAMQRYAEDATNNAAIAERSFTGVFQRGEDALLNFVHTGKFRLGDLWRFMADEYIRNWYRMQVASAATGGGGGGWFSTIVNLASSYFGGGSGLTVDTGGIATNTTGGSLPTAGGRAGGGEVAAGRLYDVNEKGPELLTQDGKDYLMVGGKGGYITPLTNGGGAGGSKSQSRVGKVNVTYIGKEQPEVVSAEQDDAGDWHLVMEEAARRAERRIAGSVASGKGPVANAMRARGVNMNGSNAKRG